MIWTLVTVGFVVAAVGLGALYTVAVVGSADEHSAHRELAVDELSD
ncbi:hypothetical protein HII28_04600 [Planctomonas sp. JC2975]|nr:hypothetical protein [Planctomonas sp. JC2975]NNC11157.1 hypothetical protein [Planctomonas sp. JC2975]